MVAFVGNQFVQQQYKLKSTLSGVLDAEEIGVILSGLDGGGQLQSMAPLMGISALVKGKITREEFIRRYGHRGPDEAEIAAPRTAEDTDWINKLIGQWRDADPDSLLLKQKENRDRIWKILEQRQPKQVGKLRKLCAAAITRAHNRELAKSENFRQAWVMRKFVEKSAAINRLPADDLFYLSKNELIQFLQGDRQVLEHIAPRRETYAAYTALPPLPNLISGPIDPFRWAKLPNRRTDYFSETPSNHQVEDDKLVTGEILVTSFTNVGWTPLFPRAAAIITDIGAPLSHAAIIARELGIPAVVGTGSATMKLRTGNKVRVNGSQGDG